MIDMHVHILPGVDDGSRSMEMTKEMMHRAKEAGITRIICTPHVYAPEDQVRNRGPLEAVRKVAHAHRIPFSMGCEFNYRTFLGAGTRDLEAYCLGPTRCILLEFSNDHMMPGWEATISELVDNGYLPIIAHPERYHYIQQDIGVAQEMCDLGCELQVDAGGLMAKMLSAERRTARRLLKSGMASYVASDAHRPFHYDTFEKAYRTFSGEWPTHNRLTSEIKRLMKEARK